jgi:TonB family protein
MPLNPEGLAHAMRRDGVTDARCLTRVAVDSLGAVTSVIVARSSGYAEADSAAVRAMSQSKFDPAVKHGRAVSATVEQAFHLEKPVKFRVSTVPARRSSPARCIGQLTSRCSWRAPRATV